MIHTKLTLTRPLIVFDTETTGVNVQVDRIVELGFQRYTSTGVDLQKRVLVNPGIPIPPDVTKIHGITDEDIRSCMTCNEEYTPGQPMPCTCGTPVPWWTFKQRAANLARGFSNCDFAGKNVRFDLKITAAEMARAGVEWSYVDAYIIDAERLEQIGEPRTLSDLYRKHIKKPCPSFYQLAHALAEPAGCAVCGDTGQVGAELEGAHGALVDVEASAVVIAAQLDKYSVLPRSVRELHELQWPGWIDGEGKFRMVNGVACFTNWGKYAGQPMRKAGTNYWDFILGGSFSADIKKLAADAKLGKFPGEKNLLP